MTSHACKLASDEAHLIDEVRVVLFLFAGFVSRTPRHFHTVQVDGAGLRGFFSLRGQCCGEKGSGGGLGVASLDVVCSEGRRSVAVLQ